VVKTLRKSKKLMKEVVFSTVDLLYSRWVSELPVLSRIDASR
jgi:hypothetical protein